MVDEQYFAVLMRLANYEGLFVKQINNTFSLISLIDDEILLSGLNKNQLEQELLSY